MVDRSIVELNAHFAAPSFHVIGREILAIIGDDVVGDTVSVYDPEYKVYNWSGFGHFHWFSFYPFGELIYHDQ